MAQAKQTILQLDSAFRFDHLYSTYGQANPKDIVQLRTEIQNNIQVKIKKIPKIKNN